MFFYFWRGYLLYPLSDLPALTFAAAGCWFILRVDDKKELQSYLGNFVGGLALLAIAAMTRPVFLADFVLIPILSIVCRPQVVKKVKALIIYCVLACVLIASFWAPQLYLNKVKPTSSELAGANLYAFQLSFGLSWEKYETTTGNEVDGPRVIYWNRTGGRLFDVEHLTAPFDFKTYWRVVKSYPLELYTIYVRHFFNALDLQFSDPYPATILSNRILFSFLNFTILFLSSFYLLCRYRPSPSLFPALFYAALTAPCLVALPGVVETRFFLPVYLIAYGALSYGALGKPKEFVRALLTPRVLVSYFCFITLAFTLQVSTMSSMANGVVLLYNGKMEPKP